ncbi:MAG: DUF2800 domain-containing protein [Aeromonadaceae bacterium]
MKLKPTKAPTAEHALLSPSSARKWLGCPAALACEVGIPNESGAAAVNGTTMHTMAEKVLKAMNEGSYGPSFGVETWFMSSNGNPKTVITDYGKGDIAAGDNGQPGNVEITDDFVAQVSKYVNYCAPIMAAAEVVEIESRVSLTRILHPGFELNGAKLETFGTADFVALLRNPDGAYTLIVGDLKTGRHKVTAAENKQMMLYALGLLRKYRLSYDISAVKLFIFQPYAGGADEWDTTPTALEHFAKFASKQALKALDAYQRGKKGLTPADFRPSNDACQWCRFAEKCNAKVKAASHTMDEMADIGGLELTPDVLKAEWDKLPMMRQHIADIEKAMYTHLMAGKPMDGLKLVEGRPGNRVWSDVAAVERAAKDDIGNMMKEVLMSPTEAEKAVAKEAPELWAELEKLITRKPGQPSIAAADDKRPAWAPVSDEDLA